MQEIIIAALAGVGWLSLSYLLEPLFPMGDWRWGVLSVVMFVAAAFFVWDKYRGAPSAWRLWRWGVLFFIMFIGAGAAYVGRDDPQGFDASGRPYFIPVQFIVWEPGDGAAKLSMLVKNNSEFPAEDIRSDLLILPKTLNPALKPLHAGIGENANDVPPGGSYHHYVNKLSVAPNTNAAFIVFWIHFSLPFLKERFTQQWYMVFDGVSDDGNYKKDLSNATPAQKEAILDYMKKRDINISDHQD